MSLISILKTILSSSGSNAIGFTKEVIGIRLTNIINISNNKIISSDKVNISNKIVDKDIKNLPTIIELVKFKISNLTKSDLAKSKNSNFIKAKFYKTDFFIFKAKKTFTYLWKTFIKVLIIHYFELK